MNTSTSRIETGESLASTKQADVLSFDATVDHRQCRCNPMSIRFDHLHCANDGTVLNSRGLDGYEGTVCVDCKDAICGAEQDCSLRPVSHDGKLRCRACERDAVASSFDRSLVLTNAQYASSDLEASLKRFRDERDPAVIAAVLVEVSKIRTLVDEFVRAAQGQAA